MHTQFWLKIPAFVRGTECKSAKRLFSGGIDELLQMMMKKIRQFDVEAEYFWCPVELNLKKNQLCQSCRLLSLWKLFISPLHCTCGMQFRKWHSRALLKSQQTRHRTLAREDFTWTTRRPLNESHSRVQLVLWPLLVREIEKFPTASGPKRFCSDAVALPPWGRQILWNAAICEIAALLDLLFFCGCTLAFIKESVCTRDALLEKYLEWEDLFWEQCVRNLGVIKTWQLSVK